MRILIVEDDVHLASSLTEILATHRYAVDTVKDGEAGWEHIKVQEYDLILMDITLPKLDGVSLCRRLRDPALRAALTPNAKGNAKSLTASLR